MHCQIEFGTNKALRNRIWGVLNRLFDGLERLDEDVTVGSCIPQPAISLANVHFCISAIEVSALWLWIRLRMSSGTMAWSPSHNDKVITQPFAEAS